MNESRRRNRRIVLLVFVSAILLLGINSRASAQATGDLTVVKSGPSTVVAGTDVTYTLSVTNVGDTDIPGPTTLTDTLPANMTFVSEEHFDPWVCTAPAVGSAGTITCANPNTIFQEGGSVFTFVFHLAADVSPGTMISNTATIFNAADSGPANNSSTTTATVGTPPPPPLAARNVLISEFRFSGPGGNQDDYVELYCNRDTNCDISRMSLRTYDPDPMVAGDISMTFLSSTVIPGRQFLLVGDARQYSLSSYGILDFDVPNPEIPDFFTDNQGVQLIGADEPIVIDSVGFIGGGNQEQYIEGTGLQPASSRPADQYAYVRKRGTETAGLPQDTDNNSNDFVLVSVTAAAHSGITTPPILGAPGPKGLTSPFSYNSAQVTASLVQPSADAHASPNFVRTGSGNSGTISIRRSFTNNTSQTFEYLSFRVIAITTTNSPNTLGNQSELHLVTSPDAETFQNSQGRTVVIRGTVLEYDPICGCQPAQPNGGGLNSTVYADLGEARVNPGNTIDVQFLLNVLHAGFYRFYVYVEAGPIRAAQINDSVVVVSKSRTPAQPPTPRKMINLQRGSRSIGPIGKRPKSGSPVPTKSFGGPVEPAAAPLRVWIPSEVMINPKKRTRKRRLRRKSSAALRAKAEARNREGKPEN